MFSCRALNFSSNSNKFAHRLRTEGTNNARITGSSELSDENIAIYIL